MNKFAPLLAAFCVASTLAEQILVQSCEPTGAHCESSQVQVMSIGECTLFENSCGSLNKEFYAVATHGDDGYTMQVHLAKGCSDLGVQVTLSHSCTSVPGFGGFKLVSTDFSMCFNKNGCQPCRPYEGSETSCVNAPDGICKWVGNVSSGSCISRCSNLDKTTCASYSECRYDTVIKSPCVASLWQLLSSLVGGSLIALVAIVSGIGLCIVCACVIGILACCGCLTRSNSRPAPPIVVPHPQYGTQASPYAPVKEQPQLVSRDSTYPPPANV
eukprot:TRINITY_DN66_c0_g2_i1.p1 TRINITY_DN66_c0_g2~~TRINITY_DN66_c0_g2_i1.p1  ORF type:complete len:272 (+),score=8.35 TRINITY_DN66_c0_g2_i1:111-926(+)